MSEHHNPVREKLAALPEAPLPDALWRRMETGRKRQMRRRRQALGLVTLAVVGLIAIPTFAPLLTGADAMRETAVVSPLPDNGDDQVRAELRALDQALQAAYDRGATDAEIAPMWVTRAALLAGMPSPPANRI